MNFDDILNAAVQFSSEGIGAFLLQFFRALFAILYPANADAATPIDIPL